MSLALNCTLSGETLYFYVNCHDATGAASDADSAPAWRIYRQENGTAVANGTMALLDDTNTTGFYSEAVSLATYDPGEYVVYVAATVDSITATQSMAFVHGRGECVLRTTIATLASQTSFTLTAGPAEDNALNNYRIVVRDSASADQFCAEVVLDYTGSTKTVTLSADPAIFTMAVGDFVELYPPDLTLINLVSEQMQILVSLIDAISDSVDLTNNNVVAVAADTAAVRNVTDGIENRICSGVVDTGASTTSLPTSSLTPAPGVADQFLHRVVTFRNNTITANLRGVSTVITDLTSTTLTVSPALPATPAAGDTFDIL